MSSKINVLAVVTDHIGTLRDHRSGRTSVSDLITFFAVPVAFGVAVWVVSPVVTQTAALPTFFTLVAGFLLNMMLRSVEWVAKDHEAFLVGLDALERARRDRRRLLLAELHQTLTYSFLVALIGVAGGLVIALFLPEGEPTPRLSLAAVAALAMHLLLTLLMVLKRTYAIGQAPPPDVDGDQPVDAEPETQILVSPGSQERR